MALLKPFKVGTRLTYPNSNYSVIILAVNEVKYKTNPTTNVYTVYCERSKQKARFDDWMLAKGLWYEVEQLEPEMVEALYGELNV